MASGSWGPITAPIWPSRAAESRAERIFFSREGTARRARIYGEGRAMGCGQPGETMNTKHIIAAISVATALAVITPAYAGGLGGHLGGGGGLGGGLSGMSGMNRGLSGQVALQGQGALGGSINKPNLHPATKAVKQGGSVTGDAAGQAAGSVS